jgi:hypothetical protein
MSIPVVDPPWRKEESCDRAFASSLSGEQTSAIFGEYQDRNGARYAADGY